MNVKKCPICDKPSAETQSRFCSSRCANVDLNRWLKGVYAVAGEPVSETQDDEDQESMLL